MQAFAKTKYVRISPQKARLVADLIRGMKVEDALVQLSFTNLKGGHLLRKTVVSAVANAETRFADVRRSQLRLKEVRVDEGPIMKRAKSKCRGARVPIMKRMSHFLVVVEME